MSVKYRDGLPVISVPLPSRRENCDFTLKPITHTVGDFLKYIQEEDGGIDRVAIYSNGRFNMLYNLGVFCRPHFRCIHV